MADDLKELLVLLKSHQVEFLVIGAHALAFHARPRFTEDVDLWVNRAADNADRLRRALDEFGTSIGQVGADRFAGENRNMIRIGAPPNMIDLLNFAGDESFEEVWNRSELGNFRGVEVRFPSREDLIRMKRSADRPQDRADVHELEL